MPVVRSEIIEDRVFPDGRRSVTERHWDEMSQVRLIQYWTVAGSDLAAPMRNRIPELNDVLVAERQEKRDRQADEFDEPARRSIAAALRAANLDCAPALANRLWMAWSSSRGAVRMTLRPATLAEFVRWVDQLGS